MNPSQQRATACAEPGSGESFGVRFGRAGPVMTVTLDRPRPSGTDNTDPLKMLERLGRDVPGDVRAVIVDGVTWSVAGPDVDPKHREPESSRWPALEWLQRPDVVSIAVVRGQADGLGLAIALMCDLRVVSSDARLVVDDVGRGTVPRFGSTRRLVDLIGYARALGLCLMGRPLRADEARDCGLATVVAAPEEIEETVSALVAGILELDRDAVIETKALLASAAGRTIAAQAEAEEAAAARLARPDGAG